MLEQSGRWDGKENEDGEWRVSMPRASKRAREQDSLIREAWGRFYFLMNELKKGVRGR